MFKKQKKEFEDWNKEKIDDFILNEGGAFDPICLWDPNKFFNYLTLFITIEVVSIFSIFLNEITIKMHPDNILYLSICASIINIIFFFNIINNDNIKRVKPKITSFSVGFYMSLGLFIFGIVFCISVIFLEFDSFIHLPYKTIEGDFLFLFITNLLFVFMFFTLQSIKSAFVLTKV